MHLVHILENGDEKKENTFHATDSPGSHALAEAAAVDGKCASDCTTRKLVPGPTIGSIGV